MLDRRIWLLLLILLLGIAACTSDGTEPAAAPDDEAEQVAEEALPAARLALAEFLGVDPDALQLATIEDAEWPNACLGLPAPGEVCAEVITPGFLITFTADSDKYAVRTDRSGREVRVEAAIAAQPPSDELPPAVQAARAVLAQQLDFEPGAVEVLSFEQREWSDSCLGLGGPTESCAAVITPGWQVMLGMAGEAYEVRTDLKGAQVRVADEPATQPAGEIPGPELDGAVLFYQRSGGLAGEIVTVRAYPDGTVERIVGRPEPETPVEVVAGDAAAVETLLADLEAAGYFELERSYLPEDTCCDRFLYLISVQGDEAVHTVEALEDTPGTPEALQDSIDLIEAFIVEAFGR